MNRSDLPPIHEKIVDTDLLTTAFNRDKLGESMLRRVVNLACGHRVVTKNLRTARCMRCEEMLWRSILTGEEDYESFRHGNKLDTMEWLDDPVRELNEDMSHE